ncbi:MAG: type III secretion system stator protein SctL [Paracoccaceae bacterium]
MADAIRLSLAGLTLPPRGGVLTRAEVEAAQGATDLLEAAGAEAEAIRARAVADREAAVAEGLAQGRAEAAREAAARLAAESAVLDRALAGVEAQLATLVADAVREIVGDIDADERIRRTVRAALAQMRSQKRARLHVPTEGLAPTRAAIAEIGAEFPEVELIDVIEDPKLGGTDLRLETDLGVVSFVMDDTLDELRALLTARR